MEDGVHDVGGDRSAVGFGESCHGFFQIHACNVGGETALQRIQRGSDALDRTVQRTFLTGVGQNGGGVVVDLALGKEGFDGGFQLIDALTRFGGDGTDCVALGL